MGLLLSIDTATPVCSVALHRNGCLLATQSLHLERSHAESLWDMIDHLLRRTGCAMPELVGVAVSAGPGSYTGLRIGASAAKGLCYALGVPLIAVGTLEAMIQAVKHHQGTDASWYCPMLDARRMEVYCMLVDGRGHVVEVAHPREIHAQSFQELLAGQVVTFFGDGMPKCRPYLSVSPQARFVDRIFPAAAWVGELAIPKWYEGDFVSVDQFTPHYLKPFYQAGRPLKALEKNEAQPCTKK